MLMIAGVLCFFMLTGLKKSVAQDVQVKVFLPYSGNYNEWNITFTNENTNEVYYFETDNTTFSSAILGTVPAGTYRIDFDRNWYTSSSAFEIGVYLPPSNSYIYKVVDSSINFDHIVVEEGTDITISQDY